MAGRAYQEKYRHGYLRCVCPALLLLCSAVVGAEDNESWDEKRRHRLDLSVASLDAKEGDVYTFLPGYTLTLNKTLRLSVTANYTWVSPQGPALQSDSGLGDTDFLVQYDPSQRLTSGPWIPDNVGLYFGLTTPTGKAEKNLGADEWVYRLGLGWAINPVGDFYLAPSVEYSRSFSHGSAAVKLETAYLGCGLYWLSPQGIWAGYTPYAVRDMRAGRWGDDHRLVVGKMWRGGFGVSLEYGRRDRIDRASIRDDYTGFLNLYYQFGRVK